MHIHHGESQSLTCVAWMVGLHQCALIGGASREMLSYYSMEQLRAFESIGSARQGESSASSCFATPTIVSHAHPTPAAPAASAQALARHAPRPPTHRSLLAVRCYWQGAVEAGTVAFMAAA